MEEIDKLKQEVATAKAELERLKRANVQPSTVLPLEQPPVTPVLAATVPTPPEQDPRTEVKKPILEPSDSLITRKVATLEVLKHLGTAKITGLISIAGFFCTSLAATFNKAWGAMAAFVFSMAIIFYLFSVIKEIKRLQHYYKVKV